MSGINSDHNKFETCRKCPHRTVEPNCHTTCEGYLYRIRKKEKIAKKRKEESVSKAYEKERKRWLYERRMI